MYDWPCSPVIDTDRWTWTWSSFPENNNLFCLHGGGDYEANERHGRRHCRPKHPLPHIRRGGSRDGRGGHDGRGGRGGSRGHGGHGVVNV
jgi:hypothetical protein